MTLITVVCYDFVIFSRSKSHTFEKSTLSPRAVIFRKIRRKKQICFFSSALFTFVLNSTT